MHYRETRERMVDLAGSLTEGDATSPVPSCPAWVVKDVYAHVVGVCADVLAGRIEGVATDPWTARQVAARTDRPLATIIGEWLETGPAFDEALVAFGEHVDPRVVLDIWSHEQDVRGAVGKPGGRAAAVVPFALETLVSLFASAWAGSGRPPVRVVGSTREWVLGDGEPVATLRADDAELVRLLVGRRSRAQALALWDADAAPYVDHLVTFTFAATDIIE